MGHCVVARKAIDTYGGGSGGHAEPAVGCSHVVDKIEGRLTDGPSTRHSHAEVRARVKSIYKVHRPDDVDKVDGLLQEYGHDYLYQTVCAKYGINEQWPGFQEFGGKLLEATAALNRAARKLADDGSAHEDRSVLQESALHKY